MFKIKLLTLLLVSSVLFSCAGNKLQNLNNQYSLGYIGGEYDGLILKNLLKSYLLSFGLYDEKSNLKIESSITHPSTVYITNIDNTSDRIKIVSNLNIKIINQTNKCQIYTFDRTLSQFYIFADSNKYTSNDKAQEEIKKENTENLIKLFINNLLKTEQKCVSSIMMIRDKYY
ncbi:MAG: hypothetical protein CBD62_01305 [Candidatus Pelagibacter sp. TMED202]|nr:MAG: hypothetical protein CBD62_01305 [Candidatus Pelagibacter sp. TMED202]|tara:strand:+ start:866 stop:1384 length:519 start_codon:yes stop_codon:yes gene_type:complete